MQVDVSNHAKAIGFFPIIDPNSSLMKESIVGSEASVPTDSLAGGQQQMHMDSAPLLQNKQDYMDEKFAGSKDSAMT